MANEKRLIDAHDLWTDIMMLPHNGDMISSEEVEQAIINAPTVDAVEVVHGRWIGDGWGSYIKRCSVCRSVPLREVGGRHDACYSNYCPYCGAKMDENKNP